MHAESIDTKPLFYKENSIAITSKHKDSGDMYLALFNISDEDTLDVEVNLSELNLNGNVTITNLWTGEKLGDFNNTFSQNLKPHDSGLYKLETAE